MINPEKLAEKWIEQNQQNGYRGQNYLMKKAFLDGYQAAIPKWISVEEELPSEDRSYPVVVPTKAGSIIVDSFFANGGFDEKRVTHWLKFEIPPIPKER